MSDELFIPGRPLRRTSIACMMQRHRWDNSVDRHCTCCGISKSQYEWNQQAEYRYVQDAIIVRPEHK